MDQPVEQFPLAATATATVLAVDIATFGDVAKEQLAATFWHSSRPGHWTPTTRRFAGIPHGRRRRGGVSTDGLGCRIRPVDPAELLDRIKGKSIPEAQAILDDHGTPSIVMSPDFLPLPDDASRIDLTVTPPQAASVNMHTASLMPADRSMSVVAPSRHVWVAPVTRLLGIDLGERRIGIALGDPDSGHARPLVTIARRDIDADAAPCSDSPASTT